MRKAVEAPEREMRKAVEAPEREMGKAVEAPKVASNGLLFDDVAVAVVGVLPLDAAPAGAGRDLVDLVRLGPEIKPEVAVGVAAGLPAAAIDRDLGLDGARRGDADRVVALLDLLAI